MAKCAKCGRQLSGFSFGKKICQWCVEYEAAQRGEVGEDQVQKVMPAPWTRPFAGRIVTPVLVGINAAVFVAMAMSGIDVTAPTTHQLINLGANAGELTLAGQWWRLVTCMFLHGGLMHIGFNMWCLWDLGLLCESLYGPWTLLALYFVSGVGGSLASVAWHPRGISVGASGAIFGLAGALIASYGLGEFSLPRAIVSRTLRSVLAFVAFNLLLGAISPLTDNAAHVGGLAAGAMIGALIALLAPERAFFSRMVVILISAGVVGGGGLWLNHARGFDARVSRVGDLLMENKTDEAVNELQKIIRQRPEYAPAHVELAHAYFQMRQFAQAENELKRVIELEPQNGRARYELGITYLNEGRVTDAKAVFNERLAKLPNDSEAHFGLGMALAADKNCAAAIQEYTTAVRLAPDSSDIYYEIGNCYLKLQRYDDAISALEKEQQQSGDDHYIEAALAKAYAGKGMTQKAQEAQQKSDQLAKSETNN